MKLGAKLLHPRPPASGGASVKYERADYVNVPCYGLEQPLKQQYKVAVGLPGVLASWGEWPFIFKVLGCTSNYILGAWELSFNYGEQRSMSECDCLTCVWLLRMGSGVGLGQGEGFAQNPVYISVLPFLSILLAQMTSNWLASARSESHFTIREHSSMLEYF